MNLLPKRLRFLLSYVDKYCINGQKSEFTRSTWTQHSFPPWWVWASLKCAPYLLEPATAAPAWRRGGGRREEDAVVTDLSEMTAEWTWSHFKTTAFTTSIISALRPARWWRRGARSEPCRSSWGREEGGSNRWSWSIISYHGPWRRWGKMTSRGKGWIARGCDASWTAWASWRWRTAWNSCVCTRRRRCVRTDPSGRSATETSRRPRSTVGTATLTTRTKQVRETRCCLCVRVVLPRPVYIYTSCSNRTSLHQLLQVLNTI